MKKEEARVELKREKGGDERRKGRRS